jgi:hypothetical protein
VALIAPYHPLVVIITFGKKKSSFPITGHNLHNYQNGNNWYGKPLKNDKSSTPSQVIATDDNLS